MDKVAEPQVDFEIGGIRTSYWADIWRHRELLQILVWRDLTARYKQTALGASWNVIRPLLMMLIFTLVMRAARFPTFGAPAAIFVWAGLLPWQFFSFSLVESAVCIFNNTQIVAKIYFPRILIPLGTVLICIFDFFVSLGLLVIFSIILRFVPGEHIWALPLFFVMLFAIVLGSSTFVAGVSVKYRDIRQMLPMLVQLGLYATPVFYPVEVVSRVLPSYLLPLYKLNPMVGIIEGFRWSIVGRTSQLDSFSLCASIVETILIFFFGIRHYLKIEATFADIL